MLPTLLRRAALLPTLTTVSFIRPASTMASPPTSFTLDRSIFNQALYDRMRSFWFGNLTEGASAPNFDAAQKWFGVAKSDGEKEAFDGECRQNFVHALEAVAPEKLALPKFESYEKEIEHAADIAAPFLPDVKAAQQEDERKGADTLLSMILLLDQMSRNIYRDSEGLRKVYLHYDRLSFSLVYAAMRSLPSNPIDLPFYLRRPVYRIWLLMPMVHSEHLPTHEKYYELARMGREAVVQAGDEEAQQFADAGIEAEDKHVDLLRRFGRYPHRNEYVGRRSTAEEEEYLKDGETFGVKKSGGGKEEGKSEL